MLLKLLNTKYVYKQQSKVSFPSRLKIKLKFLISKFLSFSLVLNIMIEIVELDINEVRSTVVCTYPRRKGGCSGQQ